VLVIPDEQLAHVEEAKLRVRVLDIAHRRFPGAVHALGHVAVSERVARAVQSAGELGLRSRPVCISYCLLSTLLGTNLASLPAFQDFWKAGNMPADEKMRLFMSRLVEAEKRQGRG
jgi:hypothetical protein